jgi:hypothetical protein
VFPLLAHGRVVWLLVRSGPLGRDGGTELARSGGSKDSRQIFHGVRLVEDREAVTRV